MTVKAKTLVKDKFWIVEEHGQKLGTLQRYTYKGPMKSKLEMQQVLNNAVKEFQNTNPSN